LRVVRIRGSILSLSDWGCTHRFFPYWLRLFFCVFVKDQLFPFWVLSFVRLYFCQRSTPSFLGFGRLYFSSINSFLFWGFAVCTSQISTPSFFGVCTSVLRQISTPSFLAEIVCCSFVPLCHNHMFHLPLPWVEMNSAKGARIYPAITLIGPSVLCWRKGEKQVPR